jgi:hypothetical protein
MVATFTWRAGSSAEVAAPAPASPVTAALGGLGALGELGGLAAGTAALAIDEDGRAGSAGCGTPGSGDTGDTFEQAASSARPTNGSGANERMIVPSVHDGGADDSAVHDGEVRRFVPALTAAVALLPLAPLASLAAGCGYREPVPAFTAHDARFGRLAGGAEAPSQKRMCEHWMSAVVTRDAYAISHVSFPESNVQDACFTTVTHDGRNVSVGKVPRGCSYPEPGARTRLEALADELDGLADDAPHRLFPCSLRPDQRAAARRQNVRALRAMARSAEKYPYSAVVVPGHGVLEQADTALAKFLPGESCRALAEGDLGRLGAMPVRSERAADALRGGVAPVVIVSGGAVHSTVVEAFALMQLLQCREEIAADRILVEPCADHTHTNLRDSARWIDAMNGRAAYLLTDDWIQSEYFQDFSGFELLMGSVDQRSLRDWGYLVGSWRQSSIGNNAGFWFTPYRFWAEARDGLGSMTCVDLP